MPGELIPGQPDFVEMAAVVFPPVSVEFAADLFRKCRGIAVVLGFKTLSL
jgi:hypothetical protein